MSRFTGIESADHPHCNALIICDRIIVDERTKKKTLVDLFDTLNLPALPIILRPCIFVSLVRGTDDTSEVYLGLFAPSGATLLQSALQLQWVKPHLEFIYELPMKFSETGDYDLRVFVGPETVLAQRRLVVQTTPPPQGAEPE